MSEKEIVIDTDEIKRFMYLNLIKRGFAPGSEEIEEMADIVFDYLIHVGIIEEV